MFGRKQAEPEVQVVDVVDLTIEQALQRRASDIHFEPREEAGDIRFRVDGVLHTVQQLEKETYPKTLRRLKVMGELDFSESRKGQDGRARRVLGDREIDLRISVFPSLHGEKTVIRLLEVRGRAMGLENLGLTSEVHQRLTDLVDAPQGAVLVTGPTGSGKSTTLFSILARLNQPSKSIVTIEDPVECILPGLTQIQVKREQGVTYADILRSILRKDPDVIMVGEIRDQETAETAFRAAQTGHLLLSTLHTNSASTTVTRLRYMGLPAYLLTSALRGIVAQRLVRKICPHCCETRVADPATRQVLEEAAGRPVAESFSFGRGCSSCSQTGFLGRLALFEVLAVTERIKEMMFHGRSALEVETVARQEGMRKCWKMPWLKPKTASFPPMKLFGWSRPSLRA